MKHILLVECDNLLEAGLVDLLSGLDNVRVQRLKVENLADFLSHTPCECPDVLILDEICANNRISELLSLFKTPKILKTIIVDPKNNSISIYDKCVVPVTTIADFMASL